MVGFGSVPNYVQGPDITDKLGGEISESVGSGKAFLVVDKAVQAVIPRLENSLREGGIEFIIETLEGEVSLLRVRQCAKSCKQANDIKTTIGVGSGLSRKAIDFSKLLGRLLDARNVVLLMEAPSDGAPSHAAVAFDEKGKSRMMFNRSHAPDLVLVDTKAIAAAPVRAFVAAIADALCKKYEFETAREVGKLNFYGARPPFFIPPLAEVLHRTLLTDSLEAAKAVRNGKLCEVVERVITAVVLLSTLVWENGGYVGAHGIATTLYNSGFCKNFLHGEHVAFGLLLLLMLQNRMESFHEIRKLFRDLGLPDRISALGIYHDDSIEAISNDVHTYWRDQELHFTSQDIQRAIRELEKK